MQTVRSAGVAPMIMVRWSVLKPMMWVLYLNSFPKKSEGIAPNFAYSFHRLTFEFWTFTAKFVKILVWPRHTVLLCRRRNKLNRFGEDPWQFAPHLASKYTSLSWKTERMRR